MSTVVKKGAAPIGTAPFVSLGTEIEAYLGAQSKLSREHLPKRLTQKPLFRRVCALSPRREGNVRFPRSRQNRLSPRCVLLLDSLRGYLYRVEKNRSRLIWIKSIKNFAAPWKVVSCSVIGTFVRRRNGQF